MPVIKAMLRSMQKTYGKKKGEDVYYAMENKAGGTPQKLRSYLKNKKV